MLPYPKRPFSKLCQSLLMGLYGCLLIVALMGCEAAWKIDPLNENVSQSGANSFDEQRDLAPGTHRFTLNTPDGRERLYDVYVPVSTGAEEKPVVFNLHGGGGSAEAAAYKTGMNTVADGHGFLVVYPQGIAGTSNPNMPVATWNAGECCGPAVEQDVDDVGYMRQVLMDLESRVSIDAQRVYITGISNGALMTYRLACEAADLFAAIAPVAPPGLDIPDCAPSRAVPTLHIHGTLDGCADFFGSDACGGCFQEYLNALGWDVDPVTYACESIPEYVESWRDQQGCADEAEATYRQGTATCSTWSSCADGGEVTFCADTDMGHTWPSGKYVPACANNPDGIACTAWMDVVGPLSKAMGPEDIWAFLSQHFLP